MIVYNTGNYPLEIKYRRDDLDTEGREGFDLTIPPGGAFDLDWIELKVKQDQTVSSFQSVIKHPSCPPNCKCYWCQR